MSDAFAAPRATYRAAGFWRRAVASVVDTAIVSPFALTLCVVTATIGGLQAPRLGELGLGWLVGLALAAGPAGPAAVALALLTAGLYSLLFIGLRGQTPGKRLLGIRVVDRHGGPPSLTRSLVRTAGYGLSALGFSLGFFWIGFDREKRGLHDWLAGTYVVHESPTATGAVEAAA